MPTDRDFESLKRDLAANVADLRLHGGWSQQQVAEAAGLDPKHVQKVEYGVLNPSLRTLVRLARGLEVTVAALLAPNAHPAPKRKVGRPPKAAPPALR